MIDGSIKHICFDLDGTLMDSYHTIFKSTIKTLEHLQISGIIEDAEMYKRIGHHFQDIFSDLKIDVPDLEHFINVYKSFYFDFIDESRIYPGVQVLLPLLHEKGINVSLLTTKAQDQADKILEHFNLEKHFQFIMGRQIGIPVKPSPEPLLMICERLGISPSETIIIGDTELDIRCGKAAGTKTCAVTFGYRSRETLMEEKPDYTIDSYSDIISSF